MDTYKPNGGKECGREDADQSFILLASWSDEEDKFVTYM